jgi:hypothetical protein
MPRLVFPLGEALRLVPPVPMFPVLELVFPWLLRLFILPPVVPIPVLLFMFDPAFMFPFIVPVSETVGAPVAPVFDGVVVVVDVVVVVVFVVFALSFVSELAQPVISASTPTMVVIAIIFRIDFSLRKSFRSKLSEFSAHEHWNQRC